MNLFIFGSTGDLVKRKVIPALQKLKIEKLKIYAIGRKEFENKEYKDFVCEDNCSIEFKKTMSYIKINYNQDSFCDECNPFLDKEEINFFYLALPPNLYENTLKFILGLKRKGYKVKILIEKPLGESLAHFKELKKIIDKEVKGDIFISDHYLFKNKILSLEKNNFQKLKIISTEKLGLEKRAGYYDESGALKDMVQSHLLNVLFKLYPEKIKLEDVKIKSYVNAQYGNGIDEGYVKELGKKSDTETFVSIELIIKGKNILIITGKKLKEKIFEIEMDGKKIKIPEENSYIKLFEDFLSLKPKNFPSINQTFLSWEIIEKINKLKSPLEYYKENSKLEELNFKIKRAIILN